MKRKSTDLIFDTLRRDLSFTQVPETNALSWNIAKREVDMLVMQSGPSKTTMYGLGILVGSGWTYYLLKMFPKSKIMKIGKLFREFLAAQTRLKKVLEEEYYRIDEAIKTEEDFLNMMAADVGIIIHFKVIDDGLDRKIDSEFKMNMKYFDKKKKDEDENPE